MRPEPTSAAASNGLGELSAFELVALLKAGEIRPEDATQYYQRQIENHPELGAFVTVTPSQADRLLEELPQRSGAALWGLPHADKDLAVRAGVPTLFGSLAVAQAISAYPQMAELPSDPIVVQSDDLGLISLGKTNTPEFGLYGYTESEVAPPARHPEDLSLGAGGSSGGAAAAVAGGLLPAAIGSDGGGSVRIPAATVGLVGLKPGVGRVIADRGVESPTGVVSGPLTRTVLDAALFYAALAGEDTAELERRLEEPESQNAQPLRTVFATDSPWHPTFPADPHPLVLKALEEGLGALRGGEPAAKEISLATPGYGDLFTTAWFRAAGTIPETLNEDLFNPVTRWLVRSGRELTEEEIEENQRGVVRFRADMAERLADADLIVTPALGLPPQATGSYPVQPEENFAKQVSYSPYTSWVNLMGWPAITLPVGRWKWGPAGKSLPFGVQLIAKPGQEWQLLRTAARLEREVSLI